MNLQLANWVKLPPRRKWLLKSHLHVTSKAFPWSGFHFRFSVYCQGMASFRVLSSLVLALGVMIVCSAFFTGGTRTPSSWRSLHHIQWQPICFSSHCVALQG